MKTDLSRHQGEWSSLLGTGAQQHIQRKGSKSKHTNDPRVRPIKQVKLSPGSHHFVSEASHFIYNINSVLFSQVLRCVLSNGNGRLRFVSHLMWSWCAAASLRSASARAFHSCSPEQRFQTLEASVVHMAPFICVVLAPLPTQGNLQQFLWTYFFCCCC